MKPRFILGRYDFATYFAMLAYSASSVVVPVVLVELAAALDFPLTQGGLGLGGALQIGRALAMIPAMLICGFLGNRWGKAKVLGFAMIFIGGGIFSAAGANWYLPLFASLMLAGLGEGVIEGLATPIIQESHRVQQGRYINFAHSFWSIGVCSTTVLVGWLLLRQVSWRYILIGCSLLAWPAALLYLWPYHGRQLPVRGRQENNSVREVWQHAVSVVKEPRFWLFFVVMIFAGGGEFCLTFWAASFVRLVHGGSALLGGAGTALFAAGMIAGRILPSLYVRQKNLGKLVIGCGAAGSIFALFPPFAANCIQLFVLLFLLGVTAGPFWPSVQSYAVDRLKTHDSTTIFILLSCAGVPGCALFTWLMGVVGDSCIGFRYSFFLVPVCFAAVALLVEAERRRGEDRNA